MTDHNRDQARTDDGMADSDEALGRLLRLAGPRQTASDDRVTRVRAVVYDAWRTSVRARTIRHRLIVGTGLLAAAALVVLAVVGRPRDQPGPASSAAPVGRLLAATGTVTSERESAAALRTGDALTAGATVHTSGGAFATIALTGGGELRLDADTAVVMRGERDLRIDRGAIYIDSGSAPRNRLMTIRTALGIVRDIGTRFEVRVGVDGLRVRVRDGTVEYERDAVRRAATAGAELVVSPTGSVESGPVTSYGPAWEWVERAAPPFRLEGQTLAAFLGWVSREGGRSVQFATAALERESATITLHGSIDGLTTDEALAVVLPTCGLAHRIQASRLIIFRPASASGGAR